MPDIEKIRQPIEISPTHTVWDTKKLPRPLVYLIGGGVAIIVIVVIAMIISSLQPPPTAPTGNVPQNSDQPGTNFSTSSSQNSSGNSGANVVQPTSTQKTQPETIAKEYPTSTSRPTLVQPTLGSCPGAYPQRVRVGNEIKVCTKSDRLIVREQPNNDGKQIIRIYPGTYAKIIDGPKCADNSSWWEVEVQPGITVYDKKDFTLTTTTYGWVREGSDDRDTYFICKTKD